MPMSSAHFLALYGGQSFEAASASPFYALATWNPEALRGDPTFDMFADALDTGLYREVPRPDAPEESQIHDFISGWLALVYDDPLTARRLLSRRGPPIWWDCGSRRFWRERTTCWENSKKPPPLSNAA